jgi:hypothetical protein
VSSPEHLRRDRLSLLLFPPLALTAPLLEAFGTLSIPVFIGPAGSLFAGVVVLGLVLGGAAAALLPDDRSPRLRHVGYVAALVVAVLVIIDVAAGGHRILTVAATTRAGRFLALVLIGASLFAALWAARRKIAPVLFVAAAVFLASTVALNISALRGRTRASALAASSPARADLPPLVYIVLDEAMGVDGLEVAPGGEALARDLREQLTRHGFRVYGRAFSRHFASSRSIPDTLNFDFRDNSWSQPLTHHENGKVRSTLFERLAQDGYQVVSYGTPHIDVCFTVASRCEVLPSFNPASPYIEHPRARDLYLVMSGAFAESYTIFRSVSLVFAVMGWPPSAFSGFDAETFPRWFDRFEADVVASPRGRAYFAHMVMPHAPYVLDAHCRDTGAPTDSYYLLAEIHGLGPSEIEQKRQEGYPRYFEQYRCAASRLEGLLARLDALPRFADATIVVHGDHGTRMSPGQYAEHLSDRDLIDNYSALFAIRGPGITPGVDGRSASVQRLIAEYFDPQHTALVPDDATVVIDSEAPGHVVVRRMPDFGHATEVP